MLEVPQTGLKPFGRGKVRETFDLGDQLLIVSTDRISAFDVIMRSGVPDKGKILNQMAAFWFAETGHLGTSHFLTTDSDSLSDLPFDVRRSLQGRSMIVNKAERIDIECVVRGYISGSAWREFQESGTIAGNRLGLKLVESDELPEPLFTPAIKNDTGHDQNISVRELIALVGTEMTAVLEERSLALYQHAQRHARERGIIIADSKFEFGFVDGQFTLIDEIFTPDSSRFWDRDSYSPGSSQESFDKQFLRDWLTAVRWDHEAPAPDLPQSVIDGTRSRYLEAFTRMTGTLPTELSDEIIPEGMYVERAFKA